MLRSSPKETPRMLAASSLLMGISLSRSGTWAERRRHAAPMPREAAVVVVDVVEGKATQPGGQGVGLVIVRDTQGALKADLATGAGMDLGKAEFQGVVAQLDHGWSLVT